jgi:hypothetical protein
MVFKFGRCSELYFIVIITFLISLIASILYAVKRIKMFINFYYDNKT